MNLNQIIDEVNTAGSPVYFQPERKRWFVETLHSAIDQAEDRLTWSGAINVSTWETRVKKCETALHLLLTPCAGGVPL